MVFGVLPLSAGHRHQVSLPRPTRDDEFDSLVKKAVELAKSKTAMGLPGYLGPVD